MIEVFITVSAVLIPMAIGYLLVRLAVFSETELGVLTRFVLNIALPALILQSMTTRPLAEFFVPGYLLAFAITSLVVLTLAYQISRHALGMGPADSTFQAMGAACTNTGFIGYPLLLVALPALAPQVLALNFVIENLIMIPLVLILAERATGKDARPLKQLAAAFARVIRSPIIIAMLVGSILTLSSLEVPRILDAPMRIFASSASAVSLFVVGGLLAGMKLQAVDKGVALVVAGKLVVKPLLFAGLLLGFAATGLFSIDANLIKAGIVVAAIPSAAIYPIFAYRYGVGQRASRTMLIVALVSLFTLPLALGIVGL